MCLIKAKRIKCKKDIVCYKLAFVSWHLYDDNFNLKTAEFKTLYQYQPIIFNKEETASLKEHDDNDIVDIVTENEHSFEIKKYKKDTSIYGGMFHSYKKMNDAIEEANKEEFYCYVIKCTIPKDSILFKGDFAGYKSYASSKIIFDNIVYSNYKLQNDYL